MLIFIDTKNQMRLLSHLDYYTSKVLVKNCLLYSIINNVNLEEQNTVEFQSNIKKVHSKTFKEVAIEWFEYKLSLTKESVDNPKPLSPKTLQGYNDSLYTQILPFKNIIFQFLTKEKNWLWKKHTKVF